MKIFTMRICLMLFALCMSLINATGQTKWQNRSEVTGNKAKVANEENPSQMWIGYVDNDAYIYENDGIGGFPEDLKVGGAIKLDSSLYGKYKGGKIAALAIGYSSSTGTTADIFIRDNINGNDLVNGSGSLNFGWNIVDFDEPLVIEDGMDELFFGFYITMPAQQYALPVQRYAIVDNSCFLWTQDDTSGDKEVWNDWSSSYGMLLLKAVIECEDGSFDNMLEVVNVRNHDLHVIGDTDEYILINVKNVGMNDINSIGLTYTYNGEEISVEDTLPTAIEPGKSETISATFPTKGSADVTVSLDKANGEKNKMESSVVLKVWGVTEEVAAKYTRRPVMEFFESEYNSLIPKYKTDYFMPGFAPYEEKFSVLARHCDDQFSVGDNEDLRLLLDLVDNDSMNVYIPTFSVDRMDKLSDPVARDLGPVLDIIFPDYVSPVYEEALASPTFASVNIASSMNEERNRLNITVSGQIEDGIVGDEPLFLSVYVTEDNVDASNQETSDPISGYVHNNVIRVQPTDMYGKQLENNSGAYSEDFEIELDESWKIDDMKIVAFLNRGADNSYYNKEIINSGEFDVKNSSTGVGTVVANDCRVYAGQDCVVVEGAERYEIYDVRGYQVAKNSDLSGLYMVKVYTDEGSAVYKVFVE